MRQTEAFSSTSSGAADVPPSFVCPLTLEIMQDPATAADGHSYEYSAISKWLETSKLSPLTGNELPHKQLTRSHALRNAIEEHAQAAAKRQQQLQSQAPMTPGAKVILLGDSNAGKTSLVRRVKEGTFMPSASQPTIGCSFCTHTVALPNGRRHNLAIWDTAGQEKYRAFTRQVGAWAGLGGCLLRLHARWRGSRLPSARLCGGQRSMPRPLLHAKAPCALASSPAALARRGTAASPTTPVATKHAGGAALAIKRADAMASRGARMAVLSWCRRRRRAL